MQLILAFIGFQTRNPKMYNVYTNHAELQATPFLPTQFVANAATVKMLKLSKNWTDARLDIIQHLNQILMFSPADLILWKHAHQDVESKFLHSKKVWNDEWSPLIKQITSKCTNLRLQKLTPPACLCRLHKSHFVVVFLFVIPTVWTGLGLFRGLFLWFRIAAFVLCVCGFFFTGGFICVSRLCLTLHRWGRTWLRLWVWEQGDESKFFFL